MRADAGRRDRLIAGAVGLGLFVLFWLGRSRSFGPGDSAQHVLAAVTWGVPHPPGYPLQTALGWLWSRLFADPGAAVNGLSGLFAAAAAAALYLLLRRAAVRPAAALTATAFMAFSPLFWFYSLVAEVRALNDLLAIGAAYFALEWSRSGKVRSLYLFAALFGLGVSHHPTFVLLAPAFAVWLAAQRPKPRAAQIAGLIALGSLVAPYALLRARLAWSSPAYNLFETSGWLSIAQLFLRTRLGGPLRMAAGGEPVFSILDVLFQIANFVEALMKHVGPVALVLAALGAGALWKRDRRSLLAWSLWFFVSVGVPIFLSSAEMASRDQEYVRAVVLRFYLLPLIALFALAGFGAERLLARVRPALGWALAAAAFALPLAFQPLWLARHDLELDSARALVRDSNPGDLIVLGSDDSVFAALDLELVRGESGGRVFLAPNVFGLPSYTRELARRYPDLRVPPVENGSLPVDWAKWLALNPGRAVLFESGLLDAALALYPRSVPQRTLIRVLPEERTEHPLDDVRAFRTAPENAELADAIPWTQEIYYVKTRGAFGRWLISRAESFGGLTPADRKTLREEGAALWALGAR